MRFILNKIYFIYLLCLIIFFIFLTSTFRSSTNNAFITPDETVNYTSMVTFAKTFNFRIENKYYSHPGLNIVRPRGFLPNGKYLVPSKFIGMSLYYGLFYKVINENVYLLTPIVGGLGILIMYFFVLLLSNGNKKLSLLAAFILALFPPYLWWSRFSYMENIFGSVLFFFGFYLFIYFLKKGEKNKFLTSGFFLGLSCSVRPDLSLFVIVPLIIFIVAFFKEIGFKSLIIFSFIFLLPIIPILFFNNSLYGSFFTTGTHYSLGFSEIVPLGLAERSLKSLFLNSNLVLVNVSVLFALSLIGFVMIMKRNGRLGLAYFLFVVLSILIFAYVLLSGVPLKTEGLTSNSYTRYFLPLYLCIFPGLVFLIHNLSRKVKLLTVIIYIIFSLVYIKSEMLRELPIMQSYSKTKIDILKNTESNSIIIVDGLDKILYPNRQVASLGFSDFKDVSEITSNVIINLIKIDTSTPIYLYLSSNRVNLSTVETQLLKNGIYLKKEKSQKLYKASTKQISE